MCLGDEKVKRRPSNELLSVGGPKDHAVLRLDLVDAVQRTMPCVCMEEIIEGEWALERLLLEYGAHTLLPMRKRKRCEVSTHAAVPRTMLRPCVGGGGRKTMPCGWMEERCVVLCVCDVFCATGTSLSGYSLATSLCVMFLRHRLISLRLCA